MRLKQLYEGLLDSVDKKTTLDNYLKNKNLYTIEKYDENKNLISKIHIKEYEFKNDSIIFKHNKNLIPIKLSDFHQIKPDFNKLNCLMKDKNRLLITFYN